MSTDLIPFKYGDHQIRVFVIDGEPWFAVADVARVLGYRDAHNAARVLRAEYVDSFVHGDADATTIRVLANQLQIGEKELRALLVDAKAIYQKLQGRRWSRTQGKHVAEYSWHAYATHKTWFVERDQPEAPRYHNGQMRTTLYVTPVGKVKIAALVAGQVAS